MDALSRRGGENRRSLSLSLSSRGEENSVSKMSRVMNANSCARYELKRLLQIDPPIEKLLSLLFLSFFSSSNLENENENEK